MSCGHFQRFNSEEYVPISVLRRNFWNEKYFQTSITDTNLQHLAKLTPRRFQEEIDGTTFSNLLLSPKLIL
jgi:hypothetical protein